MKEILLLTMIFCVFILFAAFLFQRNLMYFPAKQKPQREVFQAQDMQVVTLKTADNLHLESWYKPAKKDKPTILYFHGNAGHIGYRMAFTRNFLKEGFGLLLLEYRGYGGNLGKPTEQGLFLDGRAAMNFLKSQNIRENEIIFYGESLGTGIALQLATEYPVCAVILQSPYTSFIALARKHYPFLPIPVLDKYNSLKQIPKLKLPILFLHGTADVIVPYSQGLELYQAANEPKQLVSVENRGHNNLWDGEFTNKIISFINHFCTNL